MNDKPILDIRIILKAPRTREGEAAALPVTVEVVTPFNLSPTNMVQTFDIVAFTRNIMDALTQDDSPFRLASHNYAVGPARPDEGQRTIKSCDLLLAIAPDFLAGDNQTIAEGYQKTVTGHFGSLAARLIKGAYSNVETRMAQTALTPAP